MSVLGTGCSYPGTWTHFTSQNTHNLARQYRLTDYSPNSTRRARPDFVRDPGL